MSNDSHSIDANLILKAISHELGNLLQSISGCNQLIEDALADRQLDRAAGYWRIGQQKQEALSKVVQDILFLSESGIPQSAEIKLVDIIRRAVQSVSRQAELGNVALVCGLAEDDVMSLSCPDILQRCIQNILEFSIRSCAESANGLVSVSVHCHVALQAISIEIVDNGRNLNSDEIKLFSNSWWQCDQWNRFLISLAVSRRIADGLGSAWQVNNSAGPGKSFSLILVGLTESDSDGAMHMHIQPPY